MQIWSLESKSFVDFADGYSYLQFLPDTFGIKKAHVEPADASVLMHEFTHQTALQAGCALTNNWVKTRTRNQ